MKISRRILIAVLEKLSYGVTDIDPLVDELEYLVDEQLETIEEATRTGLGIDGGHHKQEYLEIIFKELVG